MTAIGALNKQPFVFIYKDGLIGVAMCRDEAHAWDMFLGWPPEEDVVWHKENGYDVLPAQVSYKRK